MHFPEMNNILVYASNNSNLWIKLFSSFEKQHFSFVDLFKNFSLIITTKSMSICFKTFGDICDMYLY